jgi:hypothetical protein
MDRGSKFTLESTRVNRGYLAAALFQFPKFADKGNLK